jgi:hypothetical protein
MISTRRSRIDDRRRRAPGQRLTTDGVRAYQDTNNDVGGPTPVKADPPPQTGDGYETLVFAIRVSAPIRRSLDPTVAQQSGIDSDRLQAGIHRRR